MMQTIFKKYSLRSLFCLAALTLFMSETFAYPNGPLKLIVPFPPGGPTDAIARLVASKLSESLGQPVYIENKAGAHGAIGMQAAMTLPSDGQTLVMVSIGTHGINPGLYKKLPYDANKDFSPVSLLVTVPIVVVARTDAPFNDLTGLISYARANPGKLSFASAGNGGSSHLVPGSSSNKSRRRGVVKKNVEVVVCVWVGGGARADLVRGFPSLRAAAAGARGGIAPRAFASTGSCVDRLWLRAFVCPGDGKCAGTLWF